MKINAGDIVELHELTVTIVTEKAVHLSCNGDKSVVVYKPAIKSVKPQPLKVGDWVSCGGRNYEFLAIRGGRAIMFSPEYGSLDKPLSELTRVEKPK